MGTHTPLSRVLVLSQEIQLNCLSNAVHPTTVLTQFPDIKSKFEAQTVHPFWSFRIHPTIFLSSQSPVVGLERRPLEH